MPLEGLFANIGKQADAKGADAVRAVCRAADKTQLRRVFRARRAAFPAEGRRAAGETAAEAVAGIIAGNPAIRLVAAYISIGDEFPTDAAIAACRHAGRKVCVPAWLPQERSYRFALFPADSELAPGPHGIPQPDPVRAVEPCDIDLFLVPGLAFDAQGGRIGYGGGWYDRLLASARPDALVYGLCLPCQLSDSPLPMDPHDIRVPPLTASSRSL